MGVDLATGGLLDPLDERIDIHDRLLRAPETLRLASRGPLGASARSASRRRAGFRRRRRNIRRPDAGAAGLLDTVAVERIRNELTRCWSPHSPFRARIGVALWDRCRSSCRGGRARRVEQRRFHDRRTRAHDPDGQQRRPRNPAPSLAALFHDIGNRRLAVSRRRTHPLRPCEGGRRARRGGVQTPEVLQSRTAAIVHLVQEHRRPGELTSTTSAPWTGRAQARRAAARLRRRRDCRLGRAGAGLTMADFEATAHRKKAEPIRRRLAEAIAASRIGDPKRP